MSKRRFVRSTWCIMMSVWGTVAQERNPLPTDTYRYLNIWIQELDSARYIFEICIVDTYARARCLFVCKIPLLARALGLKARPSARATIGYLVYKLSLVFHYLTPPQ